VAALLPKPESPKPDIESEGSKPMFQEGFSVISNQALALIFAYMVTHEPRFDKGFWTAEEDQTFCCGGKLSNVRVETDKEGGGARILATCMRCKRNVNYRTSPVVRTPDGKERSEIGTRIALASFTSGSTPTQTARFLNLAGLSHYSLPIFDEIFKELCIKMKVGLHFVLLDNFFLPHYLT